MPSTTVDTLAPSPLDFVLEERTIFGEGPEPVWTISRAGSVRHIFPGEPLARRVILELARLEHCRAWLLDGSAAPVPLT